MTLVLCCTTFFSFTMPTLYGIDLTSETKYSVGIASHSSYKIWNNYSALCAYVGRSRTFLFKNVQAFSVGFKSGIFVGHFITYTFFASEQAAIDFARCGPQLFYWKKLEELLYFWIAQDITMSSRIFLYLSCFNVPLIRTIGVFIWALKAPHTETVP